MHSETSTIRKYILSFCIIILFGGLTYFDDLQGRIALASFQALIEWFRTWPGWLAILGLSLYFRRLEFLLILLLIDRFYALNALPFDFDGEMSGAMAVSTDWYSVVQANSFESGIWWNPLGIFYFVFLALFTQTLGTTLLVVRLVSVVTSLGAVYMLYVLLKTMFNQDTAVIGSLLFAFSPIEMVWGRTDYFAFSYPPMISTILFLCTYLALKKNKHIYYFFTALMMGFSYHTYPSAQTAFLVPLLLCPVFIREVRWKILWMIPGVLMWIYGLTFCEYIAGHGWVWHNPFTINNIKTLWGTGGNMLFTFLLNVIFLCRHTFIGYSEVTHITPVALIPPIYVPHMIALFFTAGLYIAAFRPLKKEYALLLIWLLTAMLPGILSNQAEARRVTNFFPVIYTLAALPYYAFRLEKWRTPILFLFLPMFALWQGNAYFRQTPAIPPSVEMANSLKQQLQPNTLLITDISGQFGTSGEITFQLIDTLYATHSLLYMIPEWKEEAEHVTLETIQKQWFYQFTRLKKQKFDRLPEHIVIALQTPPAQSSRLREIGRFIGSKPEYSWYNLTYYRLE